MRPVALAFALAALCLTALGAARPGRYLCGGEPCTQTPTPTVVDTVTGLEWERVIPTDAFTWREALARCRALELGGHDDWRLPSMKELWSLIDYDSPEVYDKVALPPVHEHFTWSSSPYQGDPTRAWGVYFQYGGSNNSAPTTDRYAVRCVR